MQQPSRKKEPGRVAFRTGRASGGKGRKGKAKGRIYIVKGKDRFGRPEEQVWYDPSARR